MVSLRKFLVVIVMVALAFVFATPAVAMVITISIDSAQEAAPTPSPATGTGIITVNTSTGMVDYQISFSGLLAPETAAHFHGPAPRGVPAGIIFPLPLGSPKVGSIGPLTAVQMAEFLEGLWYVNIHSVVFPAGEIRGQIDCLVGNTCGALPVDQTTWGAIKTLYR